MEKKWTLMVMLLVAMFFVLACLAAQEQGDQTDRMPTVRKMTLTGTIAKSRYGYIIRSRKGNAPSEIYKILNPEPARLDELVKSGKTVSIEARIVSGDNLEVEKIDGEKYPQGAR